MEGEDIQFRPLIQIHRPQSMKLSKLNRILNRGRATVGRPSLHASEVALADDNATVNVWLRLGRSVWLPGWLGWRREVGGLLGIADAEDR